MKKHKGIHLGIIPDGSRRWAKVNGIRNYDGTQSGDTMSRIVRHILEKYPEVTELSLWAMSTENLERARGDKQLVYGILSKKMRELLFEWSLLEEKGIRVNIIGSGLGEIPSEITELILRITSKTRHHSKATLNICIGYGGRQEILDAVMASSKWLRKNPTIARLHENVFEKFLMVPRPLDVVIRTGGERRLSGFMLYQIEYAELFFTDTLWPAFTTRELDKIMKEFSERDRRYGK